MGRILWRIISGNYCGGGREGIGKGSENAFIFSFSPKTLFLRVDILPSDFCFSYYLAVYFVNEI